jgi:hypothetical protein
MADISKEKLTAEQIRQMKKAQEEFGDIEFQMDIAPYNNYQGPIDPAVSRFHGIPGNTSKLTTKGFAIPDVDVSKETPFRYTDQAGQETIIPIERNTVNTIDAGATPNVWGHEYRHRNKPELTEKENRLQDGFYAQNSSDWSDAIRMYQDKARREKRNVTKERAEKELLRDLEAKGDSIKKDEWIDGARRQNEILGFDMGEFMSWPNYSEERDKELYWKKRAKAVKDSK